MDTATNSKNPTKNVGNPMAKIAVLLVISLGLLWFSTGVPPSLLFEPQSTGWVLWLSYAKDLILPFAFYLFICLGERWLPAWRVRALLAFTIPLLLEIGQGLYYRVSTGRYVGVFDPIDIMMYALGVGLAVLVEQKIFPKLLKFWEGWHITVHVEKDSLHARNLTN
jgi:glycopeptide antibiotics resistance protein